MSRRVGTLFFYLLLITRKSECDFVNVAQNKPARMSSTQGEGSLSAGEAVDGVITTVKPQVITTISGQSSAWWTVDLEKDVQATKVEIYFRTDYKYRRHGINLYTSTEEFSANKSQLCHSVRGRPDGTDIPDVVRVTCPGRWRYLTVFTSTDNDGDGPVLDFGEVRVLDCETGYYGSSCNTSCSVRQCVVSSEICDHVTGACSEEGCLPGWGGEDCTEACSDGTYGTNCDKSCTSRQCAETPTSCDRYTGACPAGGCKAGWRGTDCTQKCQKGFYGPSCSLSCAARKCNTTDGSCDSMTGSCPAGCQDGWKGPDCHQACQSTTYGDQCSMRCSARKCRTGSSTCDRNTGWCSDGCQDGWRGLDCTLPCHAGSYGPNCSLSCASRHCNTSDGVCDVVNGSCAGPCELGWMGGDCRQACLAGSYGPNCTKLCSNRHCSASNTTCGPKTGECFPGGCETGYWGQDCTLECKAGRYGLNCLQPCSNRHCMTSSDTCHHVTGSCTDGCETGWRGEDCMQEHPGVSNLSAGLIGGLVEIVLMVILIGVIFLCYIRIKRSSRSGIAHTRAGRDDTVINSDTSSLYSYLHSHRGSDSRPESVSYLYVRHIQEL